MRITPPSRRYHELDAMRGIAAVVVMFHHFYIMFYRQGLAHSWISTLIYPLVAGHESVMLFFMLSGFVLSLPLLNGKAQSYPIYLLRRTLRIYGPYLAALALAIVGCAFFHGRLTGLGGPEPWPEHVSLSAVGQAVMFLGDRNDAIYDPAFWSLVQEMRISIIFPLLFLLTRILSLRTTFLMVGMCTVLGVQQPGSVLVRMFGSVVTVEYAGMFVLGILLATHIGVLSDLYRRLGGVQRVLIATVSLCLYYGVHSWTGGLWHLGDMPVAIGAGGLMVIALNSPHVRSILLHGSLGFMGRISYSLYLVHGTVLFALVALLRYRVSPPTLFLIFVPTVILLSWGFYLCVEAPFTRLSQKAGKLDVASLGLQRVEVGATN
jgi:peptidoglycan/LPS O-acetylase OafA/YrhL